MASRVAPRSSSSLYAGTTNEIMPSSLSVDPWWPGHSGLACRSWRGGRAPSIFAKEGSPRNPNLVEGRENRQRRRLLPIPCRALHGRRLLRRRETRLPAHAASDSRLHPLASQFTAARRPVAHPLPVLVGAAACRLPRPPRCRAAVRHSDVDGAFLVHKQLRRGAAGGGMCPVFRQRAAPVR